MPAPAAESCSRSGAANAMAAAGDRIGRAVAEATGTPLPDKRPAHLFDRINQADSYAGLVGWARLVQCGLDSPRTGRSRRKFRTYVLDEPTTGLHLADLS
ncbi:hypothetical protein [Kibdelosporangium aridum]|uniref:hypothetical protein n=1 Tax=Kibdelosporangium aridum TaxID=2030 RepID=UPI001F3856DA|nr:hypothetical protein [Kibdelosporangium aridum]